MVNHLTELEEWSELKSLSIIYCYTVCSVIFTALTLRFWPTGHSWKAWTVYSLQDQNIFTNRSSCLDSPLKFTTHSWTVKFSGKKSHPTFSEAGLHNQVTPDWSVVSKCDLVVFPLLPSHTNVQTSGGNCQHLSGWTKVFLNVLPPPSAYICTHTGGWFAGFTELHWCCRRKRQRAREWTVKTNPN